MAPMTDAYEDASDACEAAREALKQHPAGAKWYASRNDARDLVPEIRELVAEYDRCMRASFFAMAADLALPVWRDKP